MAIITFYTPGKGEAGNTISTVCFATYLGIAENKKNLLIPTGINDNSMENALWPPKKERRSGLFGPNVVGVSQNGMEELNRIIKSNKLSPELIQNYTKVALKGRLELLCGYKGTVDQYKEGQKDFIEVINLAGKSYDNVIVDLDKDLDVQTQSQILDLSDVIVALTTQRADNVKKLAEDIEKGNFTKSKNAIIALGKYDNSTRYNIKNLTRSFLKKYGLVNAIPYNSLVFEAIQEGRIIDLFLQFKNLKIEDDNTFFTGELKRLKESIEKKNREVHMRM